MSGPFSLPTSGPDGMATLTPATVFDVDFGLAVAFGAAGLGAGFLTADTGRVAGVIGADGVIGGAAVVGDVSVAGSPTTGAVTPSSAGYAPSPLSRTTDGPPPATTPVGRVCDDGSIGSATAAAPASIDAAAALTMTARALLLAPSISRASEVARVGLRLTPCRAPRPPPLRAIRRLRAAANWGGASRTTPSGLLGRRVCPW